MVNKKPNFIYILGDDHRSEYLHCTGHPIIETPNLDSMAENGILFKNAFCTSPVCTPSRASHYLGQWERKHGVNFNSNSSVSIVAWQNSFPCILRKNGYFTGWVGKNHVPVGINGYEGGDFEKSFDYFYGNHGHSFFYVKEQQNGKIYSNSDYETQIEVFEQGVMNFLDPNKSFIESCVYPLKKRDVAKPFCLCLTFNLPHDCGTSDMQLRPSDDELYKSKYRDSFDKFPLPKTYKSAWDQAVPKIPRSVYNGKQIPYYDYVRMPQTMREKIIRTSQTITGMDRTIGNIIKKLYELDLSNNTVIVFSTDHGIHFGEFGLGGKNFLYEPDLRIPMIIYNPFISKNLRGQKPGNIVCPEDLAPTVLDIAGIEAPLTYQGKSLMSIIKDSSADWRKEIFVEANMDTQNYPRSDAIRTEEFKYIRYFKRTEDPEQEYTSFKGTLDEYKFCLNSTLFFGEQAIYEELYDLIKDPSEIYNLAQDPKLCEIKIHLQNRLIEIGKSIKQDISNPDTYDYNNRF